jgi:hypothetical protein
VNNEREVRPINRREQALKFLYSHRRVARIADESELEGAVLYLRGYVADTGKRETRKAQRKATNKLQTSCHGIPQYFFARDRDEMTNF